MNRRESVAALLALGTVLVPSPIRAQSQKIWKVGVLSTFPSTYRLPSGECSFDPKGPFYTGMEKAGFVEGRNVAYLRRCSDGDPTRLPSTAKELVAEAPDVIVTFGFQAALVIGRATDRIPIVLVSGPDPIAQGWTNSLARPSGNVTGFTWEISETDAIENKAYALMAEAVPSVRRIVHIEQTDHPLVHPYNEGRKRTGKRLGVDIVVVGVSDRRDFETPFRKIRELKADAVLLADVGVFHAREAIGEQVVRSRLPVIMLGFNPSFYPGTMLSFAADIRDQIGRAADYVARILRGVKVSDLPIQRPTKTWTVVDLRVARQLGLTIPSSVLLKADRIIE